MPELGEPLIPEHATLRDLDPQNEQRDHDREHTIAEREGPLSWTEARKRVEFHRHRMAPLGSTEPRSALRSSGSAPAFPVSPYS